MKTKIDFEPVALESFAGTSVAASRLPRSAKQFFAGLLLLAMVRAEAGVPTPWTPLVHTNSDAVQLMLLLTDGTVMCFNNDRNWYKLTPDAFGSYVNGTWSTLAPMTYSRRYQASQVLKDGRVFVAGGEYGTGTNSAEVYNPLNNSWVTAPPTGQIQIGDAPSMLLPDGRVLVCPKQPATRSGTIIYDPVGNSWSDAATTFFEEGENSIVKLPDDSLLTVPPLSLGSERYIPTLNMWKLDNSLSVRLGNIEAEYGPGLLLPDGRAFFLGGTGHTALYTPTGNTNKGSWAAGPDIPQSLAMADAPGTMLVNGNVLFVCSPKEPNTINDLTPISFFEYDPVVDNYTQQSTPVGGLTQDSICIETAFLCLPDGNVLFADMGLQLYVYHPTGAPLAAWKPTIQSLAWNPDGSLHLTGTKLNGISSGASYGDDFQMDSNYPLIRLTDGSGFVYYARTFNWSSTSVATGNRIVSTEFTLPSSVFSGPGTYSLEAVANGIASDPVTFHGPVWVDFNYFSPFGFYFGTYLFPFNKLADGVAAVVPGGTIALKPGTSSETMTISKPMLITAIGGSATIGKLNP